MSTLRNRPDCAQTMTGESSVCNRTCFSRSEGTRLNSSHTEISTLSLHDALPILIRRDSRSRVGDRDSRIGAGLLEAYIHASAATVVVDRVADQVHEHAAQSP